MWCWWYACGATFDKSEAGAREAGAGPVRFRFDVAMRDCGFFFTSTGLRGGKVETCFFADVALFLERQGDEDTVAVAFAAPEDIDFEA
jgi:hypothetical protein